MLFSILRQMKSWIPNKPYLEAFSYSSFEVVPEKRGQGFGKAIIDDLLTRVRLCCISVHPWCDSEGFWVGRGFVGKSGTIELFNHVLK